MGRWRERAWALVWILAALACDRAPPVPAVVAGIGARCYTATTPDAPVCNRTLAPDVTCLSDGETSFCAPGCDGRSADYCDGFFPGGCCAVRPDGAHCFPAELCGDEPRAPDEPCFHTSGCTDRFGRPACVRLGEEPAFCTFGCASHRECRAALPGACCVDTGPGAGVICLSAARSSSIGVSCPP